MQEEGISRMEVIKITSKIVIGWILFIVTFPLFIITVILPAGIVFLSTMRVINRSASGFLAIILGLPYLACAVIMIPMTLLESYGFVVYPVSITGSSEEIKNFTNAFVSARIRNR